MTKSITRMGMLASVGAFFCATTAQAAIIDFQNENTWTNGTYTTLSGTVDGVDFDLIGTTTDPDAGAIRYCVDTKGVGVSDIEDDCVHDELDFDNAGDSFYETLTFEFDQSVTVGGILLEDYEDGNEATRALFEYGTGNSGSSALGSFIITGPADDEVSDAFDIFDLTKAGRIEGQSIDWLRIVMQPDDGLPDGGDSNFYVGGFGVDDSDGTGIDGISASAVPVPAAVWLFGSALGMLGWARRRKSSV